MVDYSIVPKRISIPLVVLILQLFLFISAPTIYGAGAQTAQALLLTFMFMTVAGAVFTGIRPDALKSQFKPLNFFIFFIGSTLLFIALPFPSRLSLFATLGVASAVQYAIIQSFVVAYTEETFFRGLLPQFLGNDIIPAVLFALFHYSVSGGSIGFMIFAFVAGIAFSYIRDFFGIYASIGVHSAFNLKALGVLDQLVRGTL